MSESIIKPGSDVVISVSSSSELKEAIELLADAEGGTILVEDSGSPYWLRLVDAPGQTDAPIVVRSANPDSPAVLRTLFLKERENLTFTDLVFRADDKESGDSDFIVYDSDGISLVDNEFYGGGNGPIDGREGQVKGHFLGTFSNSKNIVFSDNYVESYWHGLGLDDSEFITVSGNEFTKIQGDGIRIGGIQDATFSDNWLHDFYGSSQNYTHSDMIQLWGIHTEQSMERVEFIGNVLDTGEGATYQGIFGWNAYSDKGFVFKDLVLRDNVIFTGSQNMLSLKNTVDAVVENNTILWNPSSFHLQPGGEQIGTRPGLLLIEGEGATVRNNIVMRMDVEGDTSSNILVDVNDVSAENYYANHFVNYDAGGSGDLRDLMLLPDSPWNGYGSSLLWAADTAETLTAVARVVRVPGDMSLWTFDASLSKDASGYLDETDARFRWTFEDGTVLEGIKVTHDFQDIGRQEYVLEVFDNQGNSDRIARDLTVEDVVLFELDMDAAQGVSDLSSYEATPSVFGVAEGEKALIGDAFVMDGDNGIVLSRGNDHLFNLDAFTFSMDFDPVDPDTSGYLFSISRSIVTQISSSGAVTFTLDTSEGHYYLRTPGGIFADGAKHSLDFAFDGINGVAGIYVDGVLRAQGEAHGLTQPASYFGMVVGANIRSSAEGLASNISLSAEALPMDLTQPLPEPDPQPVPEPEVELEIDPTKPMISLALDGSYEDVSGNKASIGFSGGAKYVDGASGQGVRIGGGDVLVLERDNSFIHGNDAFEFNFDLKADEIGEAGNVLLKAKTLWAYLRDGDLTVKLMTDDGSFWATARDAFDDTDWHNVSIGYSAEDGLLRVNVDGILGESAASGTTSESEMYALAIGTARGSADFTLDNFEMSSFYDIG